MGCSKSNIVFDVLCRLMLIDPSECVDGSLDVNIISELGFTFEGRLYRSSGDGSREEQLLFLAAHL